MILRPGYNNLLMQRQVTALRALKAASVFLRKKFRVVRSATTKADGTLVSEADHGSEKLIIRRLKKAFPADAILSEECGEISGSSGYRWILDPIDGTHNFLAGIPIFGILLALEKEGVVIQSFCVFPMFDEVFTAEKGNGAFLNGRRIHVSSATTLQGSVYLADGNSNQDFRAILRDIQPLHAKGCRFRYLGEGPFGMTRVALGAALAATLRSGKSWDIVAPALLVEEAGGRVTDLQGNRLGPEPCALLATNGIVHDTVLPLLAESL
jgi:myo-inositol-1(or 4)-monophosphatase